MMGIAPYGESIKVYYNPIEAIGLALQKTYESAKIYSHRNRKTNLRGAWPKQRRHGVISIVQATNDATHVSHNFKLYS